MDEGTDTAVNTTTTDADTLTVSEIPTAPNIVELAATPIIIDITENSTSITLAVEEAVAPVEEVVVAEEVAVVEEVVVTLAATSEAVAPAETIVPAEAVAVAEVVAPTEAVTPALAVTVEEVPVEAVTVAEVVVPVEAVAVAEEAPAEEVAVAEEVLAEEVPTEEVPTEEVPTEEAAEEEAAGINIPKTKAEAKAEAKAKGKSKNKAAAPTKKKSSKRRRVILLCIAALLVAEFSILLAVSLGNGSNKTETGTAAVNPDPLDLIRSQLSYNTGSAIPDIGYDSALTMENYGSFLVSVKGDTLTPLSENFLTAVEDGDTKKTVLVDETVVSRVITLNIDWSTYAADKSDAVLNDVLKGSKAEQFIVAYKGYQIIFHRLAIGKIYTDGSHYYVFAQPHYTLTKDGGSALINDIFMYEFTKQGSTLVVSNIERIKLSSN